MSIITHKFRTINANNFKEDFDLSDYYIFASSVNPSLTVNSDFSANEFLENTLFGKKVDPNDVFFMIDNNRWQYETVYDQYDDKTDLLDKKFYAIVYPSDNSTGDYRVYKCLFNNHGTPSLNAPNYDQFADDQTYRMGDGYVWKYMYSISEIEYQKYAALKYAPVIYKSATISNVVGTGNFVTFFGQNDFSIGMIATVRDVEPSQFNITGRTIVSANSSTFTVAGNETGDYIASTGICYVQNHPIDRKSIDHIEVENYDLNKGYELKQGKIEQVFTNNIVITPSVGELSKLKDYYAGQNFYVKNPDNKAELYTINTYIYDEAEQEATITLLDKNSFIEENFTFEIFPRIEIKGDGTGAVAIPKINNLGTIESTLMLNKGSGYTRAIARVVTPSYGFDTAGNLSADIEAVLRPILSPEGGHGYNYEKELLSRRVLVYTQLTDTDNLSIPSSNQYTKIGLVKNPEFISNTELLFDNRIELTLNSNILTVGEIVTQTSDNEITFSAEVHEVTDTNVVYLSNYHGPYQTSSNTAIDASGYIYDDIPINTSRKIISPQNQLLDINNITRSPYIQKTGEVYYMTSFAPITRTLTSNEEYKIILEF
jgi:hypothetical protein